MHSKATHQTFITLGIIALAFAGFLPLGYSIIHLKGENNFGKFIARPAFGITHSVYYLNFLLLTIPLVCGYHGKRVIARVLVILFAISAVAITFIGCTFIGFHWSGPIHGNTGIGMISMLAGDLLIMTGCLLQIRYNRNQNQDQPTV
ncbi:hypothetical protein [Fluviicola sp.]|uniref:hypothetical protein n=1 Tax=Fluviicola sp. TaxID=1917219 RepID=UPI0031D7F9D6